MPIIPTVGRKALRVRILIGAIYAILSLGAVTMVYPFLLMLATSITSSTDTNEYRVVPRFLYDDAALFAKYADDKYAGDLDTVNALYHADFKKVEQIAPPRGSGDKKLIEAWRKFAASVPQDERVAAFRGYGIHPAPIDALYREWARRRFHGSIAEYNRMYTEENDSFEVVKPPMERPSKRAWAEDNSPKRVEFAQWKASLPAELTPVVSVDGLFAKFLKEDAPAYHGDWRLAAKVWPLRHGFDDVMLAAAPPPDAAQRSDWEAFVRTKMPLRYLRPLPGMADLYRAYLSAHYPAISALNKTYGTSWASFRAVPLPTAAFPNDAMAKDWGDFVAKSAPVGLLRVDTPENRFRQVVGIADATPPYHAADADYVLSHAAAIRRDFVTRNYRYVLDYIVLHGRSLAVTAIFCIAAILTTIIVNPMCAYALSRFGLPYAYKVLLFLLATMAFPAEVAMIPNFLLLKQLGLLNTYWALILPGAASGFSIFLLKGFFDSLPRDLYEAGTLDGASETRMFFKVTVPLSTPIFAVIALQSFTAAYGAFMFALLVCQDPRMWTLMVWLYELQIDRPQYIMFAALTVAALPTLLVFVFAQNVIMRGIILPT
jgi:ABC-type glycerol-3-phosphate transport system permease component